MKYETDDYLSMIKDKVDEIVLDYKYGSVTVKVDVKDGRVTYLQFIETEKRVKVDQLDN